MRVNFDWEKQCSVDGPGKVIEIDESKFGKSKYERGRKVEGKWVFEIYERGTKKLLLFPVDKRNSLTLTPIIRRHVLPGTTICSDEWRAYSKLAVRTCNSHSKGFVSMNGVHTQNIERSWRDSAGQLDSHPNSVLGKFGSGFGYV